MQSSSIRSFLLLINIIFIIHVSAIFHPTFSDRHYYTSSDWPGIIYSSSDWSSARSFSKVVDKITVRSVSDTLSLTNNYVRRIFVLWTTAVQRDGLTIALSVHVVVVRTCTPPLNEEATASRLLEAR